MGSPNFSHDKHLTTTYAVLPSSDREINQEYISELSSVLGKINDQLTNGKLGVSHGYHEGVKICSKLLLGGNYENSGSIEESMDIVADMMVDAVKSAAYFVESKYDGEQELDIKAFFGRIIDITKENLSVNDLIKVPKTELAVEWVLNRNKTLEYDLDEEEGRNDLITHVLDYAYWHNLLELGLDDLIKELDSHARAAAIKCGMGVLSMDKGGYASSISPIPDE